MAMDNSSYLGDLPKEQLVELLLETVRSVWSVDGLYFLGIEKRYGTEKATEIDKEVWALMGTIEAKRLRKLLNLHDSLADLVNGIKHTTWFMDIEEKDINIVDKAIEIKNYSCHIQKARIAKGIGEFPCEQVRKGFLQAFVSQLNPKYTVKTLVCPPMSHPDDLWCYWRIEGNETEQV